jgi:hypothetical protein
MEGLVKSAKRAGPGCLNRISRTSASAKTQRWRIAYPFDGAETGGAEPHIAEHREKGRIVAHSAGFRSSC